MGDRGAVKLVCAPAGLRDDQNGDDFCRGAWWAISEMVRLNGLDDGRIVRAPTYHDIMRAYLGDPPRERSKPSGRVFEDPASYGLNPRVRP